MVETKISRESTRWLILEGAAIVVSILLAFSIQAWWDQKQESDDIRDTLSAILADLRASKDVTEWGRVASITRRASIIKLFEFSYAATPGVSETELDKLMSDLGWFQEKLVINDASVNSLIASGRLSGIRDPELRSNLASWTRKNDELVGMLSQDKEYLTGVWWPFIREYGYQPQLLRQIRNYPGHPEQVWDALPIEPNVKFQHSSLLSDRRFHNVLSELWSVQNDMLTAYDRADAWIDETIALIEREIGK